jgi:hypothetical protein
MDALKHDWLTEGLIDYEYKKYILLAYLKDVQKRFNKSELYPFMADLVFHYRNLLKLKENKKLLFENFPKSLSLEDFKRLKLAYNKLITDDEVMSVIEEIIAFAIPKLEQALDEGKELYEFVEENMEMNPVGVSPIYLKEGYLFINMDAQPLVSVYRYKLTFFEHVSEKYRGISTEYLGDEMCGISRSYENLKVDLTRSFTDMPNPATYLFVSKLSFPIQQTILPVAKRLLVRQISM